ncbi:protein kinase domain-containing protein [Petropleomorpha daqingensis]|uniref:non-specific serine/threonine protein kinase n=1 Tax=Petropleomorpha daqingensis TaxID=2026353 RepID=A0A853CCK5_9ACTN|nr:protein kinase [Petropleomorpha daqingensis]NYJ05494.1 serine/threonine-protein kinase [Petropleomorpha daqingensis]
MVAPGGPPIGGRYELGPLLATGGMGQVWSGRDLLLGRPVAIKVQRSEYTGDPTFLARFRAEAQHAALLAHRNIAAVFDYGEVSAEECGEHLAYLVMELVDGEPLSAVLAREQRLDVERTLDVLHQIAAGLAAAHAAGVVHRDVKPGNVLVGRDGVLRVTDFGVAWSASDVPLTQTGQVVGTAQYLSPEQAEGGRGGPASDVYALGLIGYECLAGRRAYDGGTPVQIALRRLQENPAPLPPGLPEDVRTLIGRALCREPAERFPDGAAFRDAVDDVRAGRSLPPLEPTTLPLPPRRSVRRVLTPVAALAIGAVLGVGALQLVAVPTTTPPVAAQAAPATGVTLRSADYVGRPVDEVEAALVDLGLQVVRSAQTTGSAAPGTVLGVGPVGLVSPGQLITVTYAVAPDPAPSSEAPSSSSVTTVEAAVGSAAAAPAPAPASAGGVVEAVTGPGNHPAGPGGGPANGPGKPDDKPKPPKPPEPAGPGKGKGK